MKKEIKELKKAAKLQAELERVEALCAFEKEYAGSGYLCGIDEAGRGPLAGPVAAAAVILPKDCRIMYINDSKKLSIKKREALFEEITERAVALSTALSDHKKIDEINILQATYEAMRNAVSNLDIKPDILLNDAVLIPDINIKQVPIVKGDAKSQSIAAASIIAKVTRDRIMEAYDLIYPEYGFAKNKGYGTKEHIEAIRKYGPCPIHRMTFIKNFL